MLFIVSYILVSSPHNGTETSINSLQNAQSILADLASMLLSNITSSAATCATLLSMEVPVLSDPKVASKYFPTQSRSSTCPAPVPYPAGEPKDIPALPLLVDAFVQGAGVDDEEDPDKRLRKGGLHFLAVVFANLSMVSASVDWSR